MVNCVCCFHHWIRSGMAWIVVWLVISGFLMFDRVFVSTCFFRGFSCMRSFHVVVPIFTMFQNVYCDDL